MHTSQPFNLSIKSDSIYSMTTTTWEENSTPSILGAYTVFSANNTPAPILGEYSAYNNRYVLRLLGKNIPLIYHVRSFYNVESTTVPSHTEVGGFIFPNNMAPY